MDGGTATVITINQQSSETMVRHLQLSYHLSWTQFGRGSEYEVSDMLDLPPQSRTQVDVAGSHQHLVVSLGHDSTVVVQKLPAQRTHCTIRLGEVAIYKYNKYKNITH